MVYDMARKIKRKNILSASTGFLILTVSIIIYHFTTGELYLPNNTLGEFNYIFMLALNFLFAGGLIVSIFFCELDEFRSDFQQEIIKSFKFTLISFGIIFVVVLFLILTEWNVDFINYLLLLLLIPGILAFRNLIKKFNTLAVIRRKKPIRWLVIGLILIGSSDIFNASEFIFLLLNSFMILAGLFLLMYGWKYIPHMSEFEWLDKLDRILVIHSTSNIPLLNYRFKAEKQSKETVNDVLAGTAIGGINTLLKEILSKEGRLNEIDFNNQKVYFFHGVETLSILVANGESEEFQLRLELFEGAFEKKYGIDTLKEWDGDLTLFAEAYKIVEEQILK